MGRMKLCAWRRWLVIALMGWAIPLLGMASPHGFMGSSPQPDSATHAPQAHSGHCPEASADVDAPTHGSGHWPSKHCVDCFGLALLGPGSWSNASLPQPAEVATARPLVLTERPNRILRPPNA